MTIIPFQPEFRPALPCVFASKDYNEFRETLIEMDRILCRSGIEDRFIRQHLATLGPSLSPKQANKHYTHFRLALRHNILLAITGLSFRALALRMADSHLFQWFVHTGKIDAVRPVSKSSIKRFEKLFETDAVAELIHDLNRAITNEAGAKELLYRETALRFDEVFADSTCVKANIHFPVDWVLLRDATRTLTGAIALIRSRGLKHRIRQPELFARQMNKLCIEMTHNTRKTKDAAKARKKILRRMKKLMKIIEGHAQNYHTLLEERWGETGWSELESQIVLERIQEILDQLPQAIHQAHERLMGERRIANSEKILSLYEPDIHVLVRGKAGSEVEFGNGLYLAEQADGLIMDWDFMKDQPKADSQIVKPSLARIAQNYSVPLSYTGDRGFDSKANDIVLEELNVINGICPRSVPKLQEKIKEEGFCRLQKRRGGTEGRIGIFKNDYLGLPLRSKGFRNRKTRVEWCVLGHNLWNLATLARKNRMELESELTATG